MNSQNIDFNEIKKFSTNASHWWDLQGEFKTLHQINPLRLKFIMDNAELKNNKVLDIGCGGGILCESMAKNEALVTGIDMSSAAINIAKLHQYESGTNVEYLISTAENLSREMPGTFDVVTCLEMLEHVPDPASVVRAAATLAKPGGKIFFATINRNLKAYLFAIVGAEYIFKLLPKATHDFAKFIKPSELGTFGREAGLTVKNIIGMNYNLLTKEFYLSDDVSVNYLMYLEKI